MPVITKKLPAPFTLVEISSCGCRKECPTHLSFLKAILSALTYVKALHARMRQIIQKTILFSWNEITMNKNKIN